MFTPSTSLMGKCKLLNKHPFLKDTVLRLGLFDLIVNKAVKHHRSLSRSGSNLVASLTPPTVGDAGSHTRHSGHIYQESAPSSSFQNAPFPSIRRARQRGLAFISSVGSNSSVENSGFYGFSVSSGSVNRSHQDGDSIGRRFDRFYGWVREGFAPLPWIPVDGEPW